VTVSVRGHRRSVLWILVGVFVAIAGFWGIYLPHTKWYIERQREAQLKQVLQSFKLPPGATLAGIKTYSFMGTSIALGSYKDDSTTEEVKAHYVREFQQRGFTLRPDRNQEAQSVPSLSFCSGQYCASLIFVDSRDRLHGYAILLSGAGTPRTSKAESLRVGRGEAHP